MCLLVMLTTSTTVIGSHVRSSSKTYRRQFWRKKSVHTVRLITESIQRIPYWQLLVNFNHLQDNFVGMFPRYPMTYIDASKYTVWNQMLYSLSTMKPKWKDVSSTQPALSCFTLCHLCIKNLHYQQRPQQSGFTLGRSTLDRIVALRLLAERRLEYRQPLFAAYINLRAAFDSLDRNSL